MNTINTSLEEIKIPLSRESLKNMRIELGGIQTYTEFEKNYPYNSRQDSWYFSLDRIEHYLKKINLGISDPIQYIAYLYSIHGKGLSIESIFEENNELLRIERSSILNDFVNKLGWKKRLFKEVTAHTRNQMSQTALRRSPKCEIERQKNAQKVLDILEGIRRDPENEFDQTKYKQNKNSVERTRYILDLLGYINEEDFIVEMKEIMKRHSVLHISIAVQKILDNSLLDIKIPNFNKGRLSEISK
ncbi:MAG: hypothetical protein QM490_06080, partial [Candidatus Gracilibacteria bacterium]